MNRKQWKQLRELACGLPFVPNEKFDMEKFGTGKLDVKKRGFTCKFAGCAIGWAPKLIKNCGLKLKLNKGESELLPVYKGFESFEAIKKYFGISDMDAANLFGLSHHSTLEVSAKILNFLNENPPDES